MCVDGSRDGTRPVLVGGSRRINGSLVKRNRNDASAQQQRHSADGE
jgi:hypothetical protein